MRFPRAIRVAGLCCVMLGACAADGDVARSDAARSNYVVLPGDTLYSIAWRHDIDYRELAKWNGIGADYRLSVGQVLELRPTAGTPAAANVASNVAAPRVSKPTPMEKPPAATPSRSNGAATVPPVAPAAPALPAPVTHWVWPTEHTSEPRPVQGGGILLLGRLGQDIRAAGSGRVVYTGSGIRGYGNLIIIKHADSLLSSYAHNREVLVHEGQDVAAGQVIAHMGVASHQVSALYFEIRVNGKPADPLRYLEHR